MAADQPEQQPPPIGQPAYESSDALSPIDSDDSFDPGSAPGAEPPDNQDDVAALVAEARAQGPLPGPRPDPQQSHRPPQLPHLPDVERDEVDAIIGRVLAESTGS
jgi:hypothetical protein